jgi:hypothetical protein
MRGRGLFLWVIIVLGLALISVFIWALSGPRELLPTHRFPDGSTITIREVTYGKVVSIPLGNFWQRAAARLLPSSLSKRLGLKIVAYTNATDTTLIVIENFHTNGTYSGGRAMHFNFNTSIWASDDIGNEYSLFPMLQVSKASNDVVEVFTAPLVSHLSTNINLQLTQSRWIQQFTNYSAEFNIRNPAPRTKPQWRASHLPMTDEFDDLTVVFEGVEPDASTMYGIGGNLSVPVSSALLQISEDRLPSTNWLLAGFTAHDEEGNASDSHVHFSAREPKIFRFELRHTFPVNLDDILKFENVAIGDRTQDYTPIKGNFRGHTIEISRFSLGQFTYQISPPLDHFSGRFSISYADEVGHTFTALTGNVMSPYGGSSGFSRRYTNAIKSADVTFTFARTTNRFVEFLAYPTSARTNAPIKK